VDGIKMTRQRFLTMGLLLVLFAAVIMTAAGCNSVDVSSKGKQISTLATTENSQEKCKGSPENKNEDYVVENQVLKYAVKSYEESIATLRWAIGGIITLISVLAAAVGYVVVRHKGEYKEAVSEAKKASESASKCAEKAQEKLDSIDEMVERKLKEIENKGKAQREALIKVADKRREEAREEAERQRKISELWNESFRALKNEDYESAANKLEQIVKDFKMKDAAVYNNWGAALSDLAKRKEGEEAERLFVEAFGKYEKAVGIKPDYCEAYNNWGAALLYLAARKKGDEQRKLLGEAREKCLKAESIKRGSAAYNLACANCRLDDEGECKRWLKIGEEERTLQTREYAMKDEDLESVRDKDWFKTIRWKGE
jgi:hypothetical protein